MSGRHSLTHRMAGAAIVLGGLIARAPAQAETAEIRVAQLYGMPYLAAYVVYEENLVQKHAQRLGIPPPKVTQQKLTSGPTANDALLAGNVDFAMGGVSVLATLWDKTRGRQNVRGVTALCESPLILMTADPRIKSIADFTENDRIAVSGVKVTLQAISLQILAAKEFGWDGRFKLDPLTIGMSHPDSIAALASSAAQVKSYVALVPYNFEAMKAPNVRVISSSYDTLGGPHTTAALWSTEKWVKDNPKTYEVVLAAFEEAMDLIKADPAKSARTYRKWETTSLSETEATTIVKDEAYLTFTVVPKRTMAIADFMSRLGIIKEKPAAWGDLFHERLLTKAGS